MFRLLFDTSIWYDILLVAVIVLLVIASMKYKQFKYFLATIIVTVVTVCTVYSITQLNYYYSASGGIYGEISGIFKPNDVVITDMSFDFKNVMFTEAQKKDNNGNIIDYYEAVFLSDQVLDLSTDNYYGVFVNESPSNIIEYSKDYIIATYEYQFLGENKQVLMQDKLTFHFAFYKNSTKFTITTDGGEEAVKYWNHYFNKNAFIVNIKQINDYDYDLNEIFLHDLKKCTFELVGETYKTIYVKSGNKISQQIGNDIDSVVYDYYGWSLDGINLIEETDILITEDIKFTAIATKKQYTITYYVDDQVYETQTYGGWEMIDGPANPIKAGYVFAGWYKEDGTLFNFNVLIPDRVLATENLNIYARFTMQTEYKKYLTDLVLSTQFKSHDISRIMEYSSINFEVDDSCNQLILIVSPTYNHPSYGQGEYYFSVTYQYGYENDYIYTLFHNLWNSCKAYGSETYDFEQLKSYAQELMNQSVYDSRNEWIG